MPEEEKKFGAGTNGNKPAGPGKDAKPGENDKGGKHSKGGKRNRRNGKDSNPKPGNDFSYWNKYPELSGNAAQFPINAIPGTPLNIEAQNNSVKLANVCVVEYAPSIGWCEQPTDPFNVFARQLWLDMHRKYRGLGSYQAADLGIFILATVDIYVLNAELERIYGIYNSYSPTNRLRPRGILRAMGYPINFLNSVENNLADFRYGINRLAMKAHQLCLPKGISMLANHMGLSGFLYADSKSKRASIIAFQRKYFLEYDAASSPNGGCAKFTYLNRSQLNTYQDLLNFANDKLDVLLGDDDIARMCSDLLAAYGDNGVDMLKPMDEAWVITPTYDESILLKFHNIDMNIRYSYQYDMHISSRYFDGTLATALMTAGTPYAVIEQDAGRSVALFRPHFHMQSNGSATLHRASVPSVGYYLVDTNMEGTTVATAKSSGSSHHKDKGGRFIFDSWIEDPKEENKFEGLLWKQSVELHAYLDSGDSKYFCVSEIRAATEIICSVAYHSVINGDTIDSSTIPQRCLFWDVPTDVTAVTAFFRSMIDWAPIVFFIGTSVDDGDIRTYTTTQIDGDIDNYAPVSSDVVAKVRDAALLSAFKLDISPDSRG